MDGINPPRNFPALGSGSFKSLDGNGLSILSMLRKNSFCLIQQANITHSTPIL